MSAGNASSGSSPRPAVRLVPTNSTRRAPTLGELAVAADFPAAESPALARAASSFGAPPHAASVATPTDITQNPALMLVARQLTKEFQSGTHRLAVLRDVSFTIAQGAFVAIVGPSGSGKTTLLGLLAGLDTPTRGGVILDGADLAAMDEDARARLRGQKVGFVFQTFQLIPTLTAAENV